MSVDELNRSAGFVLVFSRIQKLTEKKAKFINDCWRALLHTSTQKYIYTNNTRRIDITTELIYCLFFFDENEFLRHIRSSMTPCMCVSVICLEFRSWIDYLILFEIKTGTLLNCFRETTTNYILINIFVVLYW